MTIEEIKKLELEECTACSGSGCYCGGDCGACKGTGLEYSNEYILTLKENLIHEQNILIDKLKTCNNCLHNHKNVGCIVICCRKEFGDYPDDWAFNEEL